MKRSSALLIAALACARTSPPPAAPAPASVAPAAAYVGRDTAVLVHGDDFTPAAVQQLGGGTRIALDADFHAFLGDVELRDVRWIDSRTIAATVPAGLVPGSYGLSLEGPYGSGAVQGVFQAIDAAPASLFASATAPARFVVGEEFTVAVNVANPGGMAALGVSAGTPTSAGPAVDLVAPADLVDIAAGGSAVFSWRGRASASGLLHLSLPFGGTDQLDASALSAQASASIQIVTPAHFTSSAVLAPASQPAGPVFEISVDVLNDGGSDALGVQFSPLSGTGIVSMVSAPPPQDIPAGATRTFVWTVRGTAEGTATLGCAGAGTDSTGGAAVAIAPVQWTVIIFTAVAVLDPTLSLPPGALPAEIITVALTLDNPGIVDALGVQPSIAVSGSGTAAPVSTPATADVPAGQSAVFVWKYVAALAGDVRFDVSATGQDARSGSPVTASASGTTVIGDAVPVSADPFGDAARFSYLFSYAGQLYLGPNADGAVAVRMNFDGTGAETVRPGFKTDFGNVKNAVSPTPPAFPTLGSLGCTADTLECGPDNEDGRGLFATFFLDGKEWLFAAGSRQTSVLKHVYLSTDTTATPQFPYVGMSLNGGTRATSAVAVLGTALYVGFADAGGSGSPMLMRMTGLSAAQSQAPNPSIANAQAPAALHSQATGLIDAMVPFGGWLYAANDGGCARHNGSSWVVCTPSAAAWAAKAAVTTSKSSDFVPSDKAVPGLVASGGRLYLARNTTAGPQLWECNPSSGVCGPGDWSLIAANQSGDAQLSQMNDPTLTAVSLLDVTSQHFYVGYDSASGLRLFRSSDPTPGAVADFAPVSGSGLGAGLTQIVDGGAHTVGGREFLYLAARSDTDPVVVYRSAR